MIDAVTHGDLSTRATLCRDLERTHDVDREALQRFEQCARHNLRSAKRSDATSGILGKAFDRNDRSNAAVAGIAPGDQAELSVTRKARRPDRGGIANALDEGRAAMGPPIVVPERLGTPHPLVANALAALARTELHNGLAICGEEPCLDIAVSPSLLPRAVRIMNALIFALEERGLAVEVTDMLPEGEPDREERSNVTRVRVNGDWIRFGFVERLRQHHPLMKGSPPRGLKSQERGLWLHWDRPPMQLIPSGRPMLVITARYRDDKIDVSDCGGKVRELIEEAVIAEGIQIVVRQVSLFTPEFEEKLKALRSDEARASEMEHAIKKEIHVKLDENPVFYQSLRDRLEQLVADRKAKRIDAAEQLRLFEAIKADLRGHAGAAERVGLSETGFAIYGLLIEPPTGTKAAEARAAYGAPTMDEAKKALAEVMIEQLAPQIAIVDWQFKDDVQREMRRLIKRQLRAGGYGQEKVDSLAESVVALLKRRRA